MLSQTFQVLEIFTALLFPSLVAGLVLGAYKAVGTAASLCDEVQVAAAVLHGRSDVGSDGFGGLESP